jgi:thymidylate synthase ThyX
MFGVALMRNKVILDRYSGGDETHAKAAWVSTQIEGKEERIPDLLKMLAESGHTSPFEHSQLSFLVTADYASHIHMLKHRVGISINTESARYREYTTDKYLLPADWGGILRDRLEAHCVRGFDLYHNTITDLVESGMTRKRAKESARYFLPIATQLNFIVTMNFNSFTHFQKLRNSKHAQLEIQEIAQAMLLAVREETDGSFRHSLNAFGLGDEV